jgi:hypothetical protein
MSKPEQVEPKWVLVEGELREVSEFADLPRGQRPEAVCPLCERQVTLKLGQVVRHHYAHQPEAMCAATHWETALHLNTKFHFYRQLMEARGSGAVLFFEKHCRGSHAAGAACQRRRREEWIEGWDHVEVEFRTGSFRPDIALLREGRVVAAIEVLVTHAVEEPKAKYFEDNGITWIEMHARPSLYEGEAPWRITDPLPEAPEGRSDWDEPWTCEPCRAAQERREREQEEQRRREEKRRLYEERNYKVTHAAMMADFYFAGGKKYREIFYVYKQFRDGLWVRAWVEQRNRRVLASVQAPSGYELINRALDQLKAAVEAELEIKKRQGLVDVVAPWRLWEPGRKFVARDFNNYPFKYLWDAEKRRWMP